MTISCGSASRPGLPAAAADHTPPCESGSLRPERPHHEASGARRGACRDVPRPFHSPSHLQRRLERHRRDPDAGRQARGHRPRIHRSSRPCSATAAIGGDIDGVRNPTLWARTGEVGPHHHRQRRADGARHRARRPQHQEPADSRQGRPDQHHVHRDQERHLLLFGSRPSAGGHGRPPRSLRRAARAVRRRARAGERARRSTSISRAARWTTGPRRAMRSPSSRAMSLPGQAPDKRGGKASAYWVSSNTGGGARKGTLTSVPFRVSQPYASFLVSGGAFTSTRVDLVLARDNGQADTTGQVIFTISGANNAGAASGRRRPQGVRRQGHRHPPGGRRDRGDGGGVPERESLGAHQLRSLPLPRLAAVLPHRDHVVGDQHAAADRPDQARRASRRRKPRRR